MTAHSAARSRPLPDPAGQGSSPGSRPTAAVSAGVALGGVALLVLVAARYRLDRTLCDAWPSVGTGGCYGAIYLLAIGALVYAWRRARAAWLPLAVHALALFAAPFLSSDPLMYAAVGRALAGGAAATTSVSAALGAGHPFLRPLPEAWLIGTSAYGPLWNQLAALIGRVAGDDLALTLRLHQGVAALALLAGAWLASRTSANRREAWLLVALCPLAIVEATIGAHNDALLVPLVAGALVAWLRGRRVASVALLSAGLLVKASALLLLGPVLLTITLATIPQARTRRVVCTLVVLASIAALFALPLLFGGPLDPLARIVERPDVPFDHCTRSLECLPRIVFRFVLHAPRAAWATGIVFRALGIAWLAWISLRAAESEGETAPIVWLALGLFFYFFLLHGWAQSWYLLPLLPSLPLIASAPALTARYTPALRLYLVTAIAYYALVLPVSCLGATVWTALGDLLEASITVLPPAYLLLRARSRATPPLLDRAA